MALKQEQKKQIVASLLLTLAAFIWGSAFVAQSEALDILGQFTFLASRSFLGVLTLIPVSLVVFKKGQKTGAGEHNEYKAFFSKDLILGGALCGVVLFAASALQQVGIISSGVGKSGFLTTLYILAVPILGLFLKRKIKPFMWVCIALGIAGMYFLCVSEASALNSGDLMLILCAVCFGVHIMVIDHFVKKVDGVRLSLIQFFVVGILSLVTALIFETIDFALIKAAFISIFYAGVLSSGVAYTLQIVSQKNLSPTVASLLMSLEAVFAALSGAVFGERLTSNEIFGCILVFIAIILAQLPVENLKFKKPSTNH
ncbi:MAG: DMT family transporter [Ruminococcaceae bacterium]|nr:DMT family transporter [Oscillospiraceae bacterium]